MKKISLRKVVKKSIQGYKNLEEEKKKKEYAKFEFLGFPQAGKEFGGEVSGKLEVEIKKPEGVKIITGKIPVIPIKPPEYDIKTINIIYPLIPRRPVGKPFAQANIKWNPSESALIYYLIEPELTENEKKFLEVLKTTIIERLDIPFEALKKESAKEYLTKKFEEAVKALTPSLTEEKRKVFLYYLERDFIGMGKIEPLLQDPEIEDISCDGVGIPIFVYHRNPLIGNIKTNVVFESVEELDKFIIKLSQRCGKNISIAQPLLDAALPDGSRVQATLGTDIARRGSNFTIRKFTETPLTPVHLLRYKTLDSQLLAFLWLVIEYGRSILICGGTASGKTSLLNAISLFIKPEMKIVSIEDTAELRLPHPHWVPQVARLPISEIGGKKIGEVDLFDLLKSSLRQRPDYLIVGEVRGAEAYVLFQQIATGHPSLSTIHADTIERLVDRLISPPISLPPSLIETLDLIIFISRIKYGNIYVRKITNIYEIIGYDREKNVPIFNEIYRWNPVNDKFETINPSTVLKKIISQYGVSEAFLLNEIARRKKVIDWLFENNIEDYRDIAKVMKLYYTDPEALFSAIE
ncbi:MAG: type II/IV secretion system ATPase subunit [Candidatus Aenigmatarchaeota archaeon]